MNSPFKCDEEMQNGRGGRGLFVILHMRTHPYWHSISLSFYKALLHDQFQGDWEGLLAGTAKSVS